MVREPGQSGQWRPVSQLPDNRTRYPPGASSARPVTPRSHASHAFRPIHSFPRGPHRHTADVFTTPAKTVIIPLMHTGDNHNAQSVPAYPSLKAVVRYDGAAFAGWQVQSNGRTVQGAIEEALSQIAARPVRVHGASRTDAGVHALGQVCSWQWNADADVARLRRSLCKMLAPSVRIESLEWAPGNFHPRKSAHSKRYAYVLHLARRPDPFLCRYAWTVPWRLDLDLLREMAERVTGTHDFAGFQGGGSDVRNTVRTLFSVKLEEGVVVGPAACAGSWRLVFHGDGFLYKMIRNITGTLVEIARNHLPPSRLDEFLAVPGPYHGFTAPPQGLFLVEVLYE